MGIEKLLLDLNVGSTQLFAVDVDVLEKNNLAAERPDTVKDLKALLDAHTALSGYILGRHAVIRALFCFVLALSTPSPPGMV